LSHICNERLTFFVERREADNDNDLLAARR
jgi:hypothetical protein